MWQVEEFWWQHACLLLPHLNLNASACVFRHVCFYDMHHQHHPWSIVCIYGEHKWMCPAVDHIKECILEYDFLWSEADTKSASEIVVTWSMYLIMWFRRVPMMISRKNIGRTSQLWQLQALIHRLGRHYKDLYIHINRTLISSVYNEWTLI